MANVHRHPLPDSMFPTADPRHDVNTLPVPGLPQAPPSPQQHPGPVQPYVHAGGRYNGMIQPMDAAGHGNPRPEGHFVETPPPIENIPARWQPQDLRFDDIGYYDMAHYPPLHPADHVGPYEYNNHGINYHARVAQGVPAQAQANVPPAPIDIFHFAGQDEPAREILRRMANRYLNDPNSQVNIVHMEPGPTGGVRVDITLELADLF